MSKLSIFLSPKFRLIELWLLFSVHTSENFKSVLRLSFKYFFFSISNILKCFPCIPKMLEKNPVVPIFQMRKLESPTEKEAKYLPWLSKFMQLIGPLWPSKTFHLTAVRRSYKIITFSMVPIANFLKWIEKYIKIKNYINIPGLLDETRPYHRACK